MEKLKKLLEGNSVFEFEVAKNDEAALDKVLASFSNDVEYTQMKKGNKNIVTVLAYDTVPKGKITKALDAQGIKWKQIYLGNPA